MSTTTSETPDLFRLLVEQAPDALIFADRTGVIRIWNEAAASLFGHSSEAAVGQSLDIIVPERLRPAHWEGFGKAMTSGQTKYGQRALKTRATHQAGHKLYVNVAFSLVKDRAGQVIGAMATAREFIEKS